ncbi:MAG: hypothetical protein RR522_03425 [Alistipes sp.]
MIKKVIGILVALAVIAVIVFAALREEPFSSLAFKPVDVVDPVRVVASDTLSVSVPDSLTAPALLPDSLHVQK